MQSLSCQLFSAAFLWQQLTQTLRNEYDPVTSYSASQCAPCVFPSVRCVFIKLAPKVVEITVYRDLMTGNLIELY